MAYRINKAFGLNTTLSKLIDEITFTVNDIDRRLQEAEKKKSETIVKPVSKTAAGTGNAEVGIPVIPINGMMTVKTDFDYALANKEHIYTVYELHLPSNFIDACIVIGQKNLYKALCDVHFYITDVNNEIYVPPIDFGFRMLMPLHSINTAPDMDDPEQKPNLPYLFFNSLFNIEAAIPPYVVYMSVDTTSPSRDSVSFEIYSLHPDQKKEVYLGTPKEQHVRRVYDLPAVEVTKWFS